MGNIDTVVLSFSDAGKSLLPLPLNSPKSRFYNAHSRHSINVSKRVFLKVTVDLLICGSNGIALAVFMKTIELLP